MIKHAFALALLVLTGCSSLEIPGSTRYFANQPGGQAFFRISSGLGGPSLAVREFGDKWSKPRRMEALKSTEPPINSTPGLAQMIQSAHRIDSYAFLQFKPDARVRGELVPSRYFLYPGGFAYPVPR